MNLSDQEQLELNELCSALVDGVITDAQRERLAGLLSTSPEARQSYVRAMALSASLHDYAGEMQADAPDVNRSSASAMMPRIWRWIAASVATATVAVALWFGGLSKLGLDNLTEQPETVAHLSGSKDCQWSGVALPPGAGLQSGQRLELAAGWAEIAFDSGAQLILEGPASVTLNSAWEAALSQGALKATIPREAVGFRISNVAVDVVDLGAEFSMVADPSGATEVFVLHGAVETKPRSTAGGAAKASFVLRERQSRRFAGDAISEVRNSEQQFQRFARKVALLRWTKPARYVHWSFDDSSARQAAADVDGKLAGEFEAEFRTSELSGPANSPVSGPWREALDCDEVRFAKARLPEFAQRTPRTVAFWVRVPADANLTESASILTWPLSPAGDTVELAWNRVPTQGAFGALRTTVGRGFVLGTTSLRDGQWHHVAIVFSHPLRPSQKMQIRQYVDGRLDAVSAKHLGKRGGKSRTDDRSIGLVEKATMWIGGKSNDAGPSGFRGAIDELFIVDRALSQKEIRLLMERNRLPSPTTADEN